MIPFGAALASARKSSCVLARTEAASSSEVKPAIEGKENLMVLIRDLENLGVVEVKRVEVVLRDS
jgi:hypothetical protein